MVASEVSEKGLAWHEELKTDVVTEGEAPTWHLLDETSANESFGRWKGQGNGFWGVSLFFGMKLLSDVLVACHKMELFCVILSLQWIVFGFPRGPAIEKNVEMS